MNLLGNNCLYVIRPNKKKQAKTCFCACTRGGNRTRTVLLPLDFESSASTNSATRALVFQLLQFNEVEREFIKKIIPKSFFEH